MFYVSNPSSLGKPWLLSKTGESNEDSIPLEVTKLLKNYQIMAIEFLYNNYRKGVQGSILNQEEGMNFPLQISAFLRAVVKTPLIVLVVCRQQSTCFWHYHLVNHGGFEVIHITPKNCNACYGNDKKLALLLNTEDLKLTDELGEIEFFSVIMEHLDDIARKRAIKRMEGKFNIGLTHRSFYTKPDQTLQWNMLNWVNPGCVGKLNEFYELDNKNFENFADNYRYWWHRLTWQFCESFERLGQHELDLYEQTVSAWGEQNLLEFLPKRISRKRKHEVKKVTANDYHDRAPVSMDKYVKLPSMDENPILTSIIKNFEISSEPVLPQTYAPLLPVKIQPSCSRFEQNTNVILSFMDDKPSTSKSESEEFILNLIK